MAVSVVMPALEMAQETGKVVSWRRRPGDHVTKGEPLLEIETDKAVVEVESPADGLLTAVTANDGDIIPVGQTIAWVVAAGESVPEATASNPVGRRMDAVAATFAVPTAGTIEQVAPAGVRMSPKARRLAREQGIDVSRMTASGAGGEILAEDVARAVSGQKPDAGWQRSVARIMAERTLESWKTTPHFFVVREVDATAILRAREALVPLIQQSHGVKLTHTDVLSSAVARTLLRHPRLNASYHDGTVNQLTDINVAIAIAVEDAVATGVIAHADRATLGDIAARRVELAERARANKLKPADISGGTFTISNLGMFGVDAFTAIIVPPQAGILAVGAITDRVVAVNGSVAVKPMMTITLSADHRVVDGAAAALFLNDLVRLLTHEIDSIA